SPRPPPPGGLLVDEEMNVTDGPRLDEAQPLRSARLVEEALARSDDHGVDLQMECVDEVVLDQRLGELRAAVDSDVPLVLLLELLHLFEDVATEHRRVVPLRALEGGGDDVLRHAVELVRELAFVMRPDRCETVVSAAAEQQRIRSHRLVDLELLALGPA